MKYITPAMKKACGFVITIAVVAVYFITFQYQFWFKEQSTIFLCTGDFFVGRVSLPGGLAAYLGCFATQFCKIPLLGGILVALVFVISWWVYRKILIVGYHANHELLAFFPLIYLASLFAMVNYNLSIVCAHLLVSLAVWLYIGICRWHIRYGVGLVLIFLMYWASNTIFYTGVALFIMHELCCKRQKYFAAVAVLYLLISLPLPGLTHLLFSLPKEECYFSGYWIMETLITAKDIKLIYPSLAVLPVVCLLVYLGGVIPVQRRLYGTIVRPLLSVVMLVGLFAVGRMQSQEKRYLESLYLLRNEKWQEIVEQVQRTEKLVFPEMLAYNFVLAHEPSLSKQLLLNEHNSINYYRPEVMKGMLKLCFSSELYFHLGFVNGAFYDYFNVSKSLDLYASAYCLSRMAYIEMVKGNYPLAVKYYTILSKTWLYAREAKEYLRLLADPALIEQDQVILGKRKLLQQDDFFWSEQFLSNLERYVDTGTDNRLASEYLVGFTLLSKDLSHLMEYLSPVITRYYTNAGVPDIYQQAALCCYPEATGPALSKLNISEKNKQLYESFRKDMASGVNVNALKKYEGTYFYYLVKR